MKAEEEKSTGLSRATNADDVTSFAYGVLADLGFEDWLMEWSKASPSICIHSRKRIFLSEKDLLTQPMWYAFQSVLHEIAHIDTYDGQGCGHTTRFFSRNGELILRYLGDVSQALGEE